MRSEYTKDIPSFSFYLKTFQFKVMTRILCHIEKHYFLRKSLFCKILWSPQANVFLSQVFKRKRLKDILSPCIIGLSPLQSTVNGMSEKMVLPRESNCALKGQAHFWQFVLKAPKGPYEISFLLLIINTNKRRFKIWGHTASSFHSFPRKLTGGWLQENSILLTLASPNFTFNRTWSKWFI